MARAELSMYIERSPDDVFGFVSEPVNNPRWRSYVIDSGWLDDAPMRPGRRGYQTSRILGRKTTVEAVITEWDPPRYVCWQAIQGGATVRSWVRVEAQGTGSIVSGGADGQLNGIAGKVLTPLAVRLMVRQARSSLAKLKD